MKERGKHIWRDIGLAVTGALAMILFYLSASAWGGLVWAKDKVQFYLEQPVSIREAQEVIKQDQKTEEKALPEFCLWGQKKDVMLTNENLSRSTQANAVLLCGNPEVLFADCRVPVREDSQGCLVDEQTAWELFGSSQAVGKELSYEGQPYTIRKVISGKEKIIAFQVSDDSVSGEGDQENEKQGNADALSRITVQKPEGTSIQELASLWEYQYGISVRILDMELLRGMSGVCVLLFPVTVCIFFWRYLYGIADQIPLILKKENPWRQIQQETRPGKRLQHKFVLPDGRLPKVLKGAASLLMVMVVLWLLGRWVRIPADYIPTRWSDFSFWTGLWKEKADGMKFLLEIPKADLDYEWVTGFFKSVGCGLWAEGLLVLSGIITKHSCFISENYGILLSENER